jgi:hypothetical protein
MMFKVLVPFSMLMIYVHTAGAAWPPKNALCQKAHVAELFIESVDVCGSTKNPNPDYLEAINHISDINLKASKLLNIPLSELFPEGIAISINVGISGLNGSAKASSNQITLTNYTNPYRWVNKGIYAHELGHALSFSKNSSVPMALKSTHRSPLLGETIADTIAFALVGEETSHEMNLPLCFSAKRVNFNQTYNNHTGFFDHYYNLHLLSACCEEYANFNADTKLICENYMLDEGGEVIKVPPYNQTRFNYLDKVSFEEHRIGIPVNSFLLTLGQHTGKDLFKEFIQSYAILDSTGFECNLNGNTDEKQKIKSEGWSLRTQLQMIRSNLKMEEKISYDVLWAELGIQAAIIIDDAELATRAATMAQNIFIKSIRSNPTLFKDHRTCADDYENIELYGAPAENCKITCLKINPFKI